MRSICLVVLGLVLLTIAACSAREKAVLAARNIDPTPYEERSVIPMGSPGYSDSHVAGKTYQISFRGNSVTSLGRALDMMNYHSAVIGRRIGETHYQMLEADISIRCGRNGASITVTGNATYGSLEDLGGKGPAVETKIAALEDKMLRGVVSAADKERAFLAHQQSCELKQIIRPEDVATQSELEAQEAAKEQTE